MLLFLALSCAAAPQTVDADRVTFDGSTAADHLTRLDARLKRLEQATPDAADISAERLNDLDHRLTLLETQLTQLQISSGKQLPATAGNVPPVTLGSVDQRLIAVEAKLGGADPASGPGVAGSGLFELPPDKPGSGQPQAGAPGKGPPPPGGGKGPPGQNH